MTVANSRTISGPANTFLYITAMNDKPPVLTLMPPNVTYTEGGGPIDIVGASSTSIDGDNLPEHRTIALIVLSLVNPIPNEDTLVYNWTSSATTVNITTPCTSTNLSVCLSPGVRYNNTNPNGPSSSQLYRTVNVLVSTTSDGEGGGGGREEGGRVLA